MQVDFCVRKRVADKMKDDVKSGVLDLKSLFNTPESAVRRAAFEKYASPELAKFINGKLEEALVKGQKEDLQKWVDETFDPKQKNGEPYKAVLRKIDDLDKLGILNNKNADSYYEDLISNKMGLPLSTKEIEGITTRANKLQTAFENKGFAGTESPEYYKARYDMDKYMESLNPSSILNVITDPIRRSSILMHISGILKKTNTELIEGGLRSVAQRLTQILTGNVKSVVGINKELYKTSFQALQDNMSKVLISKGTYNPMFMQELKDDQGFLGEESPHTQGESFLQAVGNDSKGLQKASDVASGAVRSYARGTMCLTQYGYNTPAQFFGSVAWTDTAHLLSTQFSNGDDAKAVEFFKDSLKIVPETKEGKEIRQRAMEEGLKASFQNKGTISNATISLRDALDKMIKGFNLGKQLIPIAKVPANAIGRGLDYTGLGIIRALHKEGAAINEGWNRIPEAISEMKKGNVLPIQTAVKQMAQSGVGLALAAIIVHNLNPDDYIPAFSGSTNADKNLKSETNGVYNSIKLGGRYLALSFLGPLAVPVMAGLVIKKEGWTPTSVGKGLAQSIEDVPGVSAVQNAIKGVTDIDTKNGAVKGAKDMMNATSDYLSSYIPSVTKDISQGADSVQRNTDGSPVGKLASKIPGWRETLPPKVSEVTGEPIKEEGVVSRGLMGSNLTTASNDPVVKEISRLVKSGQAPTFSGIEYTTKSIKNLINQVGDKTKVLEYYGKYYHENASSEIESDDYKEASDEDKKSMLNSIHKDAIAETLDHFDYKKPEQK